EDVLQPLAAKSEAEVIRGLAWYHLARSSYRQNKFDEALQRVKEAEKADTETVTSTTALLFRARTHEKLNQAKEAREVYVQAVRSEPNNTEALAALVRLCWAAGDKGEAMDHLRRYALVVDGDAQGLATAAEWHLKMGRL